jgi:hypothetical protein
MSSSIAMSRSRCSSREKVADNTHIILYTLKGGFPSLTFFSWCEQVFKFC